MRLKGCGRNREKKPLGRKTYPRKSIHTEISPLRFASVEMTKGRATLPEREVAGQKAFFITLSGTQAHEYSVEKHFQERFAELQIPPLRYPGFPVEIGGVGALHAPFLRRKAHTLHCLVMGGRKSGFALVGMTKVRATPPRTAVAGQKRFLSP
jgi:hypothetical protein